MKRGCDNDDDIGCTNGGVVAINLQELHEKNKAQMVNDGLSMLKKSCEKLKSPKACFILSGCYFKGVEGIVDRNFSEAYKYALNSCELNNPFACKNVASLLTQGKGVEKNEQLAETFRKKALELEKEISPEKPTLRFG